MDLAVSVVAHVEVAVVVPAVASVDRADSKAQDTKKRALQHRCKALFLSPRLLSFEGDIPISHGNASYE